MKAFIEDDAHQSVDPGDIGPRPLAQPDGGQRGQFDPAGVGNDQPGPFFQCPFNGRPDDRVVFRGVRSGDQDNLGLLDLRDGIGHGATAERRGQTGHGGAVSEPGAVIDVVGFKCGPGEFLHQIVLFVGRPGGSHHGQSLGSVLLPEVG